MKNLFLRPRSIYCSQRKGAVVVLFALLLPILIVILGFSVDYANMQRVRNKGQVIADLSAKAAADTLARTGGDVDLARQAAKDVALANNIGGIDHELRDEDIIFGRATEQADGSYNFNAGTGPFNSVRVNAVRNSDNANGAVSMYFGIFYGKPTFDLSQSATASFRDVEVCLVLDRSGSMKWKTVGTVTALERDELRCKVPNPQSRWRALDDAIEIFLDELDSTPVQETVGLVTFASEGVNSCDGIVSTAATLDQPMTTSMNLIRNDMSSLSSSVWFGGTNITAGLSMAKNHMITNSNPERDRFIIVFTDGQHNTSDFPFDEATSCAASGITVHTITFSDDANIGDMALTAANGNGEHFHADDRDELEQIFRRVAGSFAIITE